MSDETQQKYVWWYYNCHYSQTGMVSFDIEKCYESMQEDGMNVIAVREMINEQGKYDFDFARGKYSSGRLEKIPLIPDSRGGRSDCGEVYILRYPLSAFQYNQDAYKAGLLHVLKDNLNDGSYCWSKNRDFSRKTRTICDEEWCIEVTGKKWDELSHDTYDWELLYKARIEQDEFSTKNHIENTDRVFLV